MYSGKPTCKWEQLLLRWPDYKWLQLASLILHWDNNILICRKSYSQALVLQMGIGLTLLLFEGSWSHGCFISPITRSAAKGNEILPKSRGREPASVLGSGSEEKEGSTRPFLSLRPETIITGGTQQAWAVLEDTVGTPTLAVERVAFCRGPGLAEEMTTVSLKVPGS